MVPLLLAVQNAVPRSGPRRGDVGHDVLPVDRRRRRRRGDGRRARRPSWGDSSRRCWGARGRRADAARGAHRAPGCADRADAPERAARRPSWPRSARGSPMRSTACSSWGSASRPWPCSRRSWSRRGARRTWLSPTKRPVRPAPDSRSRRGRHRGPSVLAPRRLKVDRELRIPPEPGRGSAWRPASTSRSWTWTGAAAPDFFALAASNPAEYLSASHTRVQIDRLFPRSGSRSSRASGARCCNSRRTARRACTTCSSRRAIRPGTPSTTSPGHASCAENFHQALRALGASCPVVPQPVNFFMNVAVRPDGSVTFGPPQTEAGDWVLLRAFWTAWSCSRPAPSNGTPRRTTTRPTSSRES